MKSRCHVTVSCRAFTLVELMVALGVTLLMVSFFLGFTNNSLRQVKRATGIISAENQASLVLDYLDQDLSTAVMRRDGRVWLAATIQPDQDNFGDTQGLSAGKGNKLDVTRWSVPTGGTKKPGGIRSPGPNDLENGSSLIIPPYVPPVDAKTAPILRKGNDIKLKANDVDATLFRFGQAGVWLRLFSPEPDINNGLPGTATVPRAIGYQIVRMRLAKDRSAAQASYRYYLMRSTVRPFGETVSSTNAQDRSTFAAGYDFFRVFSTSTLSSFFTTGVHGNTASIYNSPILGGQALGDAGNIRQPNLDQVVAENVIDFGILVWGRTQDLQGRSMDVLLFPSSTDPKSAPNLGFAMSTEDGFTRRDEHGAPIPGVQPPLLEGSGWGGTMQNTAKAMSYGFAYPTKGNPGVPDQACIPVYVDVVLRILDEEGARKIDALENGLGGVEQLLPQRDEGEKLNHLWWRIAEEHSHVFTRRIQLPGILP